MDATKIYGAGDKSYGALRVRSGGMGLSPGVVDGKDSGDARQCGVM